MNLHERLVGRTHPSCKICAFLATLPSYDYEAWRNELTDARIGHEAFVNELAMWDCQVTEASVRRHRATHL